MLLSGTLLNSDVEYGEVDAETVLRDEESWAEAYRTGRIFEIGSDLENAEILDKDEIEQGHGLSWALTYSPTRSTASVRSFCGLVLSCL